MSCLQVDSLSKSFGDFELFSNISFSISSGNKVALIAKNGAGKSTLLKIIAKYDTADKGLVIFRNDLKISYLPQDPYFSPDHSIAEATLSGNDELTNAVLNYEMSLTSKDKEYIAICSDRMDLLNAWEYETKIKQILGRLKIYDLNKKIKELSGGQVKRIALAMSLIKEPDFLMLDEPTNHLDLEMIEWLEDYLKSLNITILMVTHDRYFLDNVCNEIIELDNNTIYSYKGNYSYFLEKRDERIDNEYSSIEKAKNLYRKELEWMRRQPKARTTKSKSREQSFYELESVAEKKIDNSKLKINVQQSYLGKKIIEATYICKSFDGVKIIDNFSYTFRRNEKIGIVGDNGTGKSTLMNILAGDLRIDSGLLEVGQTLVIGYYKQEGIQLKEDIRVIDLIKDVSEYIDLGNGQKLSASQFLEYFLFPSEVQYKLVSKLSGGEKRRLYLLTILMQRPNFLILDEPTNDLDLLSLNVLEDFLKSFQGCLLVVSHDRFFMDKIVDHIFAFQGNGIIKDFPGNYSRYREYKSEQLLNTKKTSVIVKKEKPATKLDANSKKKLSYKETKELGEIENNLIELEQMKKEIESELTNNSLSSEEMITKSEKFSEIINLIENLTERWLELEYKRGD